MAHDIEALGHAIEEHTIWRTLRKLQLGWKKRDDLDLGAPGTEFQIVQEQTLDPLEEASYWVIRFRGELYRVAFWENSWGDAEDELVLTPVVAKEVVQVVHERTGEPVNLRPSSDDDQDL